MQERETFTCAHCGQEHPIEDRHLMGDTELCGNCFGLKTVVCACCGERVWIEDAETDGIIYLCQTCYDRYYTRCTDCERIINCDDAYYTDDDDNSEYPYCYNCFDRIRSPRKSIQNYSYKPAPIFYGDGNRYFGVELEIDDGGEINANAADIMRIANKSDEHVYCKHDGSLSDGFEIVSHPMTLAYHTGVMPWSAVLEDAVQMHYLSHQAGSCGLHVHVNRDTFGDTEAEQEAAIARVLFFVENHWNELLRFSRRTRRQMEQWAARYGRKDNPKEQIEHVKNNFTDRYRAVNLTNDATIEFRMFRGTLRYNTLIATLQLVNEICELASRLTDEEMKALTWTDFCARIGSLQYPELVQYLKERRLYVCDPVAGEEEI